MRKFLGIKLIMNTYLNRKKREREEGGREREREREEREREREKGREGREIEREKSEGKGE